jgi:hypothetical protein
VKGNAELFLRDSGMEKEALALVASLFRIYILHKTTYLEHVLSFDGV